MEKKLNVYQRINAVMQDVKYVRKEAKKVNNMYSFVSHDSVAAALHDPMTTHGIVMLSSIAEMVQDGNRTRVDMDVSFVNIDEPTDRITVRYSGYGIDGQDKGIGKAISYAIKYALLKQFCLETGDDVEKDSVAYEPPVVPQDAIVRQKKLLVEAVGGDGQTVGDYFASLNKVYKRPIEELVMQYSDKDKFVTDFNMWKEAQNKPKKVTSVAA